MIEKITGLSLEAIENIKLSNNNLPKAAHRSELFLTNEKPHNRRKIPQERKTPKNRKFS
jgi:hypothetical protein